MSSQNNEGLTAKQILYLLDVREITFVYKDSDMEQRIKTVTIHKLIPWIILSLFFFLIGIIGLIAGLTEDRSVLSLAYVFFGISLFVALCCLILNSSIRKAMRKEYEHGTSKGDKRQYGIKFDPFTKKLEFKNCYLGIDFCPKLPIRFITKITYKDNSIFVTHWTDVSFKKHHLIGTAEFDLPRTKELEELMELVKKYKKRGYKKNYDNIDFDNLRKIS